MKQNRIAPRTLPRSSRRAWRFVLLLGLVSLFADMTYEGARSITGPFLGILGSSATSIGFIAESGELPGYGLRSVSGYISDRAGRYWTVTIGVFNTGFGVFWIVGSFLMGVPYDTSRMSLVLFSVLTQLVPILILLSRRPDTSPKGTRPRLPFLTGRIWRSLYKTTPGTSYGVNHAKVLGASHAKNL